MGVEVNQPQSATSIVKEHTQDVGEEVAERGKHLAGELRHRIGEEVSTQNERLSGSLRQLSDDLGRMRTGTGNDSLAAAVVQRLGEGSRQVADYLERQGPDGVVREVQEFARRKPGTFLLGAAVAGFLVGRVGKGVLAGEPNGANGSASPDGYATTRDTAGTAIPVPATGPVTPGTIGTTGTTGAGMPGTIGTTGTAGTTGTTGVTGTGMARP